MFEGVFEAWPYTVVTLLIIFILFWVVSNDGTKKEVKHGE